MSDDGRNTFRNEESGTSVVGYALIKYSAFVIIVLAILFFLANHVLPRF